MTFFQASRFSPIPETLNPKNPPCKNKIHGEPVKIDIHSEDLPYSLVIGFAKTNCQK
jgi:hypothetical protein